MNCCNCGAQINDNSAMCPVCGTPQAEKKKKPKTVISNEITVAPQANKKPFPVIKAIIISVLLIAGALLLINALAKPPQAENKSYVFVKQESNDSFSGVYRFTITCNGDTVTEIKQITETTISGYSEGDFHTVAREYAEKNANVYRNMDFIQYSYEISGMLIHETLTITDISDNLDILSEMGLVASDNSEYLSLEAVREALLQDGFKEEFN